MSHDEDRTNPAPRPSRWVSRLEQSVLPHADPIRRLAQHVWGDGSTWDIKYDAHGEYGSLHFGPPQKWREQHPFSVPLGIMHAEYGSPPLRPQSKAEKRLFCG